MGLGKGEKSEEEGKAAHESVQESIVLFLFSPASAAVGLVSAEKQGKETRNSAPNIWPVARSQAPPQNSMAGQVSFGFAAFHLPLLT